MQITIRSTNGMKFVADKDSLENNSPLFKSMTGNEIILEQIVFRRNESISNTILVNHIFTIIQFCEYYNDGKLKVGKNYKKNDFDNKIIGDDLNEIFELISCAHALEVDALTGLLAFHIASMIKGKTPAELYSTFTKPDSC